VLGNYENPTLFYLGNKSHAKGSTCRFEEGMYFARSSVSGRANTLNDELKSSLLWVRWGFMLIVVL
jgi:hypothetical protein